MLTAETVRQLIALGPYALSTLVKPKTQFDTAEFLGLTNAGEFVYRVAPADSAPQGKVFVKYDRVTNRVCATV